jgi:uncharacterized protein YraI
MLKRLTVIVLATALFVLTGCTLSSEPVRQNIPTPTGIISARPSVTIASPASGSESVVNTQILVSASATDSIGVTQMQLLANGRIVKTIRSDQPNGSQAMNAVLDFTPTEAGALNLSVIAYRAAVASDPALITLNIRAAQAQVTATNVPAANVPVINPNDPTCRALAATGLNVRQGPGTVYPRISGLAAGTIVPITGRTSDNSWWQVRVGVTIGWVTDDFVTIYGICTNIPVVQAPPPPTTTALPVTATTIPITLTIIPTTAPTPTQGLADLIVTNISGSTTLSLGGGAVSSTYAITITNTGTGTTTQFNNTLTILPTNEVVPLGVVANLRPGESIILNTSLTFRATGSYTLQVRTDSDNQIGEQSEVNNSGIINVNVGT